MRETKSRGTRIVLFGIAAGGLGLAVLTGFFLVNPMSDSAASWWAGTSFHGNTDHGRALAEGKCAMCHGPTGTSGNPQIPKLAGQNPSYLYAQLLAFRSGGRRSAVMSAIAATLSETDAHDLAAYFSEQTRVPDSNADDGLAARGQYIFFNGSGGGMMSRCAMCHAPRGGGGMMGGGMMGRGMMAMMGAANAPNLDGQHAAYLAAQLDRFASGQRQGSVMNRIAASLSKADRKAVADYLSGLR